MSVYPPSGSGGAHMDKSISGSKKTSAKSTPAKKAAPAKKTAKAAKKALPPFLQPKKGK